MNLLRFRTKMWYGLWGFYSWATMFLTLLHSKYLFFTFPMAYVAWQYAEYLERQDLKGLTIEERDSNEQ